MLHLPNRLTAAQIAAIPAANLEPATLVYNTTTSQINYYTGTVWEILEAGASSGTGHSLASVANGLTATGTNAATAYALTADRNNFTTVASGTGAILPPAVVGMGITIFNDGANTLAVYASGTDTVDGHAAATGTTLSTAHRAAQFICLSAGTWVSTLLGAAVSS